MAVRRIRKTGNTLPAPEEFVDMQSDAVSPKKNKRMKVIIGIILFVVLLVLFWFRTNSWPIVAMVGLRPVTRFEVNQLLFKQGGKVQVDDIVTEILVKNELNKNKIHISDADVNNKISDIRKSLGDTVKLEDVLAQRNMTMEELKNQVRIQMGIEKLMSDKITVTDAEITDYLKQNQTGPAAATDEAKRADAQNAVRMSKLQAEVDKWITNLKANNKVWKLPGL